MQYHTFFFWPNDASPALIVANWNRSGAPAAASRIWVYAIEGGIPALPVTIPDTAHQRHIGTMHNWSLVPVRGSFGMAPYATVFDHIAEYYAGQGANLLCWPVVSGAAWSFKCTIPAWNVKNAADLRAGIPNGEDELERTLTACDQKGIQFVGTFEMGFGFPFGDGSVKQGDPANREQVREKMKQGFREFIERYGKHPSLYGIAFGTADLSPGYGRATLDVADQVFAGGMEEFTDYLRGLKAGLRVFAFLGYRSIHAEYFPDAWDIVSRWEQGTMPWHKYLAQETEKLWSSWNRNPARLGKMKNLEVLYQYQPDDFVVFDFYSQNPRAVIYFDQDNSQEKSNIATSRAAHVYNTFFEGYFGLEKNNFWYKKLWVAPDFNPAPPYALAGYARALGHRDRDLIMAGSWNNKPAGQEISLRKWTAAFRSLPPVDMADVPVPDILPVKVRQAVYQGANYLYAVNTSPFTITLSVDFVSGKPEHMSMEPFGLQTISRPAAQTAVRVSGAPPQDYIAWVRDRIDTYGSLIKELKKLDPQAVAPAYETVDRNVNQLFKEMKPVAADLALGWALAGELALRKSVLTPEQIRVPRVKQAPEFGRKLEAWPCLYTVENIGAANLACHLYMPNAWSGPHDLSAGLKLAHDGKNLYVGLRVCDDTINDKDSVTFSLSPARYRDWRGNSQDYEHSWRVTSLATSSQLQIDQATGFSFLVTKQPDGYQVEAVVPLKLVQSADRFGFFIEIADDDGTPNVAKHVWARKNIMIWPHHPKFAYWSDARSCGELVLE
jgi:hypothetical protein